MGEDSSECWYNGPHKESDVLHLPGVVIKLVRGDKRKKGCLKMVGIEEWCLLGCYAVWLL
jgi:hypothetical protein